MFNARRGSRFGEVTVKKERIAQRSQQIADLVARVHINAGLDQSSSGEFASLKKLLAPGLVDRQRLLEQERA